MYPLKIPLAFSLALLLGMSSGPTEAATARRGSSVSAPKSKKAPRTGKRAPSPKASPAPTEEPAPEATPVPVEARAQAPAPVAPAEPPPVPAVMPSRVTAPVQADVPRVEDTRLLPPQPTVSPEQGKTRPVVLPAVVKKPWFWAVVGGVAAATTAGILLASQPDRQPLGARLGNPGAGW